MSKIVKIKDLKNYDVYVAHGDVRYVIVGLRHFELNNPYCEGTWALNNPRSEVRVIGSLYSMKFQDLQYIQD